MRNNFVLLVKIIMAHRFVALERLDRFMGNLVGFRWGSLNDDLISPTKRIEPDNPG